VYVVYGQSFRQDRHQTEKRKTTGNARVFLSQEVMIDLTLPLTRSLADLAIESLSQVGTGALGQAAERHQPDGYRKL
jgi:hypothetical protein